MAARKTATTSNQNIVILGVALIVAIGGYLLLRTQAREQTPAPVAKLKQATVVLSEQNKSGQSGTAVLTEKDGNVTVNVSLTPGAKGVAQPAHIHTGACPDVGAVKYPLTNIVDGKSETTLGVTIDTLKAGLPLAINVHKSVPQAKVYVSCGDLSVN